MVLRYVYQQGQRQLVPAGNDGSDDRGEYRVFGLEPGDYYVSAVVSQRRFAAMAFGTRGGRAVGSVAPTRLPKKPSSDMR